MFFCCPLRFVYSWSGPQKRTEEECRVSDFTVACRLTCNKLQFVIFSLCVLRLKEEMMGSSGKLSSLSLDMQRREDELSDLREKLADSKKQIQQVQREVSPLMNWQKHG